MPTRCPRASATTLQLLPDWVEAPKQPKLLVERDSGDTLSTWTFFQSPWSRNWLTIWHGRRWTQPSRQCLPDLVSDSETETPLKMQQRMLVLWQEEEGSPRRMQQRIVGL